MRKGSLKIVSPVLLFFTLILTLSAQVPYRSMTFGLYGGWSFGSGYAFSWQHRGHSSELYRFNFDLGAYVQYNFSRSIGLQVNGNYQNGTNKSEWYYTIPGEKFHEEKAFSVFSLSLNAIYSFARWKMMQFYALGGGGLSKGEWSDFDSRLYCQADIGLGVKFFVIKHGSYPALNLSVTYNYLFEPQEGFTPTAGFFRVNLGVEF